MQDLREKLKQAGIVSKTQAREARTETRKKKKRKGGAGKAQEDSLKEQEARYAAKQEAEKARARERQEALNTERAQREALARVRDLLRRHAVLKLTGNDRPFYFVGRDGRVRRLMISFELATRLRAGKVAVVEVDDDPLRDYAVVETTAASRLEESDRERILFWNKPPPTEDDLPPYGAGQSRTPASAEAPIEPHASA